MVRKAFVSQHPVSGIYSIGIYDISSDGTREYVFAATVLMPAEYHKIASEYGVKYENLILEKDTRPEMKSVRTSDIKKTAIYRLQYNSGARWEGVQHLTKDKVIAGGNIINQIVYWDITEEEKNQILAQLEKKYKGKFRMLKEKDDNEEKEEKLISITLSKEELKHIYEGLIRLGTMIEIDIKTSREDFDKTGEKWFKDFNERAITQLPQVRKVEGKIKRYLEELPDKTLI